MLRTRIGSLTLADIEAWVLLAVRTLRTNGIINFIPSREKDALHTLLHRQALVKSRKSGELLLKLCGQKLTTVARKMVRAVTGQPRVYVRQMLRLYARRQRVCFTARRKS